MKYTHKIGIPVLIMFSVLVLLLATVSAASAGKIIYPAGTTIVWDQGRPHWGLIYDISYNEFIRGEWHPKVCMSSYTASWLRYCSDHRDPQTWTFLPYKRDSAKTVVLLPTTFLMYYCDTDGLRYPGSSASAIYRYNSIWLDTNTWYPCTT